MCSIYYTQISIFVLKHTYCIQKFSGEVLTHNFCYHGSKMLITTYYSLPASIIILKESIIDKLFNRIQLKLITYRANNNDEAKNVG